MSTNKRLRNKISNLDDLLNEITRIEALKDEQEAYLTVQSNLLKAKLEQPAKVFNRLFNRVPGSSFLKSAVATVRKTSSTKPDWLTKVLRLTTPLVLSRTLLRKSGWAKKTAVLLASEVAVSKVSKASLSSAVTGIANFIRPKKKELPKLPPAKITAEEAVEANAYGIPKDSETY